MSQDRLLRTVDPAPSAAPICAPGPNGDPISPLHESRSAAPWHLNQLASEQSQTAQSSPPPQQPLPAQPPTDSHDHHDSSVAHLPAVQLPSDQPFSPVPRSPFVPPVFPFQSTAVPSTTSLQNLAPLEAPRNAASAQQPLDHEGGGSCDRREADTNGTVDFAELVRQEKELEARRKLEKLEKKTADQISPRKRYQHFSKIAKLRAAIRPAGPIERVVKEPDRILRYAAGGIKAFSVTIAIRGPLNEIVEIRTVKTRDEELPPNFRFLNHLELRALMVYADILREEYERTRSHERSLPMAPCQQVAVVAPGHNTHLRLIDFVKPHFLVIIERHVTAIEAGTLVQPGQVEGAGTDSIRALDQDVSQHGTTPQPASPSAAIIEQVPQSAPHESPAPHENVAAPAPSSTLPDHPGADAPATPAVALLSSPRLVPPDQPNNGHHPRETDTDGEVDFAEFLQQTKERETRPKLEKLEKRLATILADAGKSTPKTGHLRREIGKLKEVTRPLGPTVRVASEPDRDLCHTPGGVEAFGLTIVIRQYWGKIEETRIVKPQDNDLPLGFRYLDRDERYALMLYADHLYKEYKRDQSQQSCLAPAPSQQNVGVALYQRKYSNLDDFVKPHLLFIVERHIAAIRAEKSEQAGQVEGAVMDRTSARDHDAPLRGTTPQLDPPSASTVGQGTQLSPPNPSSVPELTVTADASTPPLPRTPAAMSWISHVFNAVVGLPDAHDEAHSRDDEMRIDQEQAGQDEDVRAGSEEEREPASMETDPPETQLPNRGQSDEVDTRGAKEADHFSSELSDTKEEFAVSEDEGARDSGDEDIHEVLAKRQAAARQTPRPVAAQASKYQSLPEYLDELMADEDYYDVWWGDPSVSSNVKTFLEDREQIFALQRSFKNARKEATCYALVTAPRVGKSTSVATHRKYLGQLSTYLVFCIIVKIPPFPISPPLIALFMYNFRAQWPEESRTRTWQILGHFRRWTSVVFPSSVALRTLESWPGCDEVVKELRLPIAKPKEVKEEQVSPASAQRKSAYVKAEDSSTVAADVAPVPTRVSTIAPAPVPEPVPGRRKGGRPRLASTASQTVESAETASTASSREASRLAVSRPNKRVTPLPSIGDRFESSRAVKMSTAVAISYAQGYAIGASSTKEDIYIYCRGPGPGDTGCSFRLSAQYRAREDLWKVISRCATHSHKPCVTLSDPEWRPNSNDPDVIEAMRQIDGNGQLDEELRKLTKPKIKRWASQRASTSGPPLKKQRTGSSIGSPSNVEPQTRDSSIESQTQDRSRGPNLVGSPIETKPLAPTIRSRPPDATHPSSTASIIEIDPFYVKPVVRLPRKLDLTVRPARQLVDFLSSLDPSLSPLAPLLQAAGYSTLSSVVELALVSPRVRKMAYDEIGRLLEGGVDWGLFELLEQRLVEASGSNWTR